MRPASKRALLSEPTPNSTFPTDQVPPPAMRDTTTAAAPPLSAPTVQDPREQRGAVAGPPAASCASREPSVIAGPSNLRTQSVTTHDSISNDSVTVPNTQRNAPNNSSKLDRLDIPQYLYNDDDAKLTFERLVALTLRTRQMERLGICPRMRLMGGGESAATGWGTPPSNTNNNNNANSTSGWGTANPANQTAAGTQQWNNNANRTAQNAQDTNKSNQNSNLQQGTQPATSQAPAPGWGPSAKSQTGPPAAGAPPAPGAPGPVPPPNSTKQQLEQLTNMREAIFSQDGWGGQHVNQDTTWDIPSSPEPPMKMDASGTPQWKPNVNNGTELWEANLRNGGQPPPQPAQKTPWGHTPTTNIGGTWGEDDDAADSSNVWTGVPNNQQQWGGGNAAAANGNGAMWGGPKKDTEWGGAGWVDPRAPDPRAGATGMDPRDLRPDPRDIRAGSAETIRMLDPRDPMRLMGGDMRGDITVRGITGRLNGAATEGFWTQPPQGPHHMHQPTKMMGPGGGGNGGGWTKDLTMTEPTGWEEPSPPSQRRNVPYDDGTSVWSSHAQPPRGVTGSGGNLSQWKDLPTGGSIGRGGAGPPGMPPSRIKPDGSVWGHGGARNGGTWDEGGGHGGWDESSPWPNKKPIGGTPLWDTDMDWGHRQQGPKQGLTKELIWNSKEFRNLVDMGYKKEDVENALRMRGMNAEDALDMLSSLRSSNMDGWRPPRHEDYDHQGSGQFPGQRFPSGPSGPMPFQPGTNAPNLLNNLNATPGGNGSGNCANSTNNTLFNAAIVSKMLNQVQSSGQSLPGAPSAASRNLVPPQSQPSTQQLRMLVQQIQMAVQAGYLNHQILNQPLAPQTLVLLNQLLQQIKSLQTLGNQQSMAQSQGMSGIGGGGGKPNNMVLQCSVLITKTKQQIQNLQNQIAAQQAIYVKQQQQHGNPGDIFKGGVHESINALPGNFGDLTIKDPQQPQSRLTQWKLPPPLDKDPLADSNSEFSRAPGSTSKPLVPSHSSPNMNPLGLTQPDGPWSSGRSADTGWPDPNSGSNDTVSVGNPDPKDTQWSAPVCQPSQPSLTDLVPEFEPGKPWKGTQIKSIEDDPSITPGSVARSPLSVGLKDTELFGSMNPSKLSPTSDSNLQPLSLSSSTWSFNPPSSTSSAFTSPQSKLPTSKGALGDFNPPTAVSSSELWAAPQLATKSRGPPPGLVKGTGCGVNGWTGGLARPGASWGAQGSGGNWGGSGSPWLLLRNLTAQIDGSTLRTLCMQHGPLQSFHLHLHQGFALAKYSSREEATKAQTALNNCVLGNTSIVAESPTDWEANTVLQQVAPQQGASSGGWRAGASTKQPVAGDTWSTGWPTNPTTASLWGNAPLDTADQARATPSSLNSYLPGDLLGGESM